jgi:tetratricopeptide (TPR) repeat protein
MSSASEPDDVLTLLDRAKELNREKRSVDALRIYAGLLDRLDYQVGDDLRAEIASVVGTEISSGHLPTLAAPEGDEVLRRMLGGLSMALFRLERYDAAILGWDQVIRHFADSDDPETRRYVVRALYMKTAAFIRLKQFDEFAVALDAATAFAKDIEDPGMARTIAAGMLLRSRSLGAEARVADRLRIYEDVLDRFAQSDDPKLRVPVQTAFLMKAEALTELGQIEQADQTFEQFLRWAARDTPGEVVELNLTPGLGKGILVYMALLDAEKQTEGGDVVDIAKSIVILNKALSVLSDSDKPAALRRKLDCMVSKARLFQCVGHHEEAMVALDAAWDAYQALPDSARDLRSLGQALHALFLKAVSVSAIDQAQAASVLVPLEELLGDSGQQAESEAEMPREEPNEEAIAARLAELHAGQFWVELATSEDDPDSLEIMATKALDLYRTTSGWFAGSWDDTDGPGLAAAILLRNIGDSYALLSQPWSGSTREQLPLTSSLLMEFALRRSGIAEWAADLGYPLELSEPDDLAESLLESQEEESSSWNPDIGAGFVASMLHHQMLRRILRVPKGREAMHTAQLRQFAIDRIAAADRVALWTGMHEQDAIGVTISRMFVAQALFVAAHDAVDSSAAVFPSREILRATLVSTEAFDWLDQHDVQVPEWLADTDAE